MKNSVKLIDICNTIIRTLETWPHKYKYFICCDPALRSIYGEELVMHFVDEASAFGMTNIPGFYWLPSKERADRMKQVMSLSFSYEVGDRFVGYDFLRYNHNKLGHMELFKGYLDKLSHEA